MAKLELTPKAKSSIKTLTWWVDQTTWLPVKSTVVESNGTPTTFILTEVRKNQGITDSTFKVDLPKGTKIVRK
jgi:outer membrane lipoprotein-sorting protein